MSQKVALLEEDNYDLDDDLPAELPLGTLTLDMERTRRFPVCALQGMVRLAPDVAEVFDSSEAINEALRTIIRVMRAENKWHEPDQRNRLPVAAKSRPRPMRRMMRCRRQ